MAKRLGALEKEEAREPFALSLQREPRKGWRPTGTQLSLPVDDPVWRISDMPAPFAAPLYAAAMDGALYCLDTDNQLHRLNLAEGAWERRRPVVGDGGRMGGLVRFGPRLHALGDGVVPIHLAYDPEEDAWSPCEPMPTPRSHFGTAVLDEHVYVVGGLRHADRRPLEVVEAYSPERDAWRTHAPLPEALSGCAAVGAHGRLHVFGGESEIAIGRIHHISEQARSYSPSADRWFDDPPLRHPRAGAAVAVTGRRLHVIGGSGRGGGPVPDEMFDLIGRDWLEAPGRPPAQVVTAVAAAAGVLFRLGQIPGQDVTVMETCLVEQVLFVHESAP